MPKRIHRRNFLDPSPSKVVENPERILRRSSTQANKGIFHLQKSLYLPAKSVKSAESFTFDKGTDQSLSRSKSAIDLSQVFAGTERTNISRATQNPSHPSSTFCFPQIQNIHSVQIPVTYSFIFVIPTIPIHTIVLPNPTIVMDARFTPLVFPAQLHDLPQGYYQRSRTYEAEGDISTQQHLDRFNDFCDLEEVDYEDAKMRLFT